MFEKQTFLQRIISSIKATVNNFSYRKLTKHNALDYDAVKADFSVYHNSTVGDYARRAYGKRLMAKLFAGFNEKYSF